MFLAKSKYLKKIKNIADMAKELNLNVYIWGEKGVGKSFLAKYIAPDAIINPTTSTINPVIIEDFDTLSNFPQKSSLLIATGSKPLDKTIFDKYFDLDIELKPLKEHKEDIEEFIKYFTNEASKELKINKDINIPNPDISENLNSLKRQIYKALLFSDDKEAILDELEKYYINNHSTYEEELKDFEKTLFIAMKKRYKSKLKISEHLKINRVTLTKKMKELDV